MKRLFQSLSSLSAWVVQPVLVLAILVVGFLAASRLSLRREPPQRSETVVYAPLVRTRIATPASQSVVVQGNGTLEARTRINLVSQVGGEVVEIHPGLRAGGRFKAGEVLARIEPRDYELAVARSDAEVSAAETQVVTIRAESEAAVEEWNRLRAGQAVPPLVSLEPQAKEADARVLAAHSQLESAKLDLARTRLALPFDGRVVGASIDIGEVISANQSVAVVYATDVFEVAVPLRIEELSWLSLPGAESTTPGSPAVVRGIGAGGPIEIAGRIARVFGELDGASRMARVVVEIDAASLDAKTASRILPGTFVDVELEGSSMEGVSELPRASVRENGIVWVIEEGRLRFARPTIVRASNGSVFVQGLATGASVITSNLEVVTEGMNVRVFEEEQE